MIDVNEKQAFHELGFNIVKFNESKIPIDQHGNGLTGSAVTAHIEIPQYVLEAENWGIVHSLENLDKGYIILDFDKGTIPKDLKKLMWTYREKPFQVSYHGFAQITDSNPNDTKDFIQNWKKQNTGLELFAENQRIAIKGTYNIKDSTQQAKWFFLDDTKKWDLVSGKIPRLTKHEFSRIIQQLLPQKGGVLETNYVYGKGQQHNGIITVIREKGETLDPNNWNVLISNTDNKSKTEPLKNMTHVVIDYITQNNIVEDKEYYRTSNGFNEVFCILNWITDGWNNSRRDQEAQVEALANAVIEKFNIKVIIDTEEILLWNGNRYLGNEENTPLLLDTQVQEYAPDVSTRTVNAVRERVVRTKALQINRDDLDKDRMLVSYQNGILKNGILEPHDPKNLNRFNMNCDYIKVELPSHELELTDLDKVFGDSEYWKSLKVCLPDFKSLYTFLEVLSYGLSKDLRLQRHCLNYGIGENGKSTFLDHYAYLQGAGCCSKSIHDLLDRFKRYSLVNRYVNIYPDIGTGSLGDESNYVKNCAENTILTAEQKGIQSFEFTNTASHIYSGNHIPPIKDQSKGWFRKWLLIHWDVQITNPDHTLLDRLKADKEGNAKLMGVLIGIRDKLFKRDKFRFDVSWESKKDLWNYKSNPLLRFKNEWLRGSDNKIEKHDMYATYLLFCKVEEIDQLPPKRFSKEFGEYIESQNSSVSGTDAKYWLDVEYTNLANKHKRAELHKNDIDSY